MTSIKDTGFRLLFSAFLIFQVGCVTPSQKTSSASVTKSAPEADPNSLDSILGTKADPQSTMTTGSQGDANNASDNAINGVSCSPSIGDINNHGDYFVATVNTLTSIKSATNSFDTLSKHTSNKKENFEKGYISVLSQIIVYYKTADGYLACALSTISPFINSSDQGISSTAYSINDAVKKLKDAIQEKLTLAREANTRSEDSQAEALADNTIKLNAAWNLLGPALTNAIGVIVDSYPTKKPGKLLISKSQWQYAQRTIPIYFDKKTLKAPRWIPDGAAAFLEKLLSSNKWIYKK